MFSGGSGISSLDPWFGHFFKYWRCDVRKSLQNMEQIKTWNKLKADNKKIQVYWRQRKFKLDYIKTHGQIIILKTYGPKKPSTNKWKALNWYNQGMGAGKESGVECTYEEHLVGTFAQIRVILRRINRRLFCKFTIEQTDVQRISLQYKHKLAIWNAGSAFPNLTSAVKTKISKSLCYHWYHLSLRLSWD